MITSYSYYCTGTSELKQLNQMVLELERSLQRSGSSGEQSLADVSKLQLNEQLTALRSADSNSARVVGQLERREQTLLTQLRQFERELSTISEQSTRSAICIIYSYSITRCLSNACLFHRGFTDN